MTGIGKTTLAERIADENLGTCLYLAVDCQRDFAEGDFIRGAIVLLGKLGDDTAQQLPEDQILPYLVQRLSQGAYWVQLDSGEALVQDDRFRDDRWGTALAQVLREAGDVRLMVTTQVMPQDWDEEGRWTAAVETLNLAGLERERVLELFERSGVRAATETEQGYLLQIAADFQHHPFILQITAGEIKLRPFNGDVGRYWRDYYQQERQQRPKLRQSQRSQVEARVRRVIEQLPKAARRLLLAGSVFNRAVPEDFYTNLLPLAPDGPPLGEGFRERAGETLELLIGRELVQEQEWSGAGWLLGQHNLVREAALQTLRQDAEAWETAHRQAADLWLNHYVPGENASNLETVRGYLEAFEHFCAVEDWDAASALAWKELNTPSQEALCNQLNTWGYYRERVTLLTQLVAVERKLGDKEGEGTALGNLGTAYDRLGAYQKAIDFYQQSLAIKREIGDKQGEGNALGNLGIVYKNLGDYKKAIDLHRQHLTISREIGDKQGEGSALAGLGNAYNRLGDYQKAIDFHQQALTIAREIGDKQGEGAALGNLGLAYHSLGDYGKAIDFHQQLLTIAREIGNKRGEGIALGNLGATQLKLEQYEDCLAHTQAALEIFEVIGDRAGVAEALKNLAELHQALGDIETAQQYCQQALSLATALGIPLQAECAALLESLGTPQT